MCDRSLTTQRQTNSKTEPEFNHSCKTLPPTSLSLGEWFYRYSCCICTFCAVYEGFDAELRARERPHIYCNIPHSDGPGPATLTSRRIHLATRVACKNLFAIGFTKINKSRPKKDFLGGWCQHYQQPADEGFKWPGARSIGTV